MSGGNVLVLLLALFCWEAYANLCESSLHLPDVIFENQTITFNCSSTGESMVNYTWTRNGISIGGGSNGSLELTVLLEWAGSCLTCHVGGEERNFSGTLNVYSNSPTITTIVVHSLNMTLQGQQSFSLTLEEREPLSLTCSAVGLPTPTARWQVGENIVSFSPTHNVPNVSINEAGNYTCVATNNGGSVTSGVITVLVRARPVIVTSPEEEYEAVKGSSVVLNCSVSGYPVPTITWLYNGGPVNESDRRIRVHSNGSLTIENVKLSDVGVYECNATNDLGSVSSDPAMLMVETTPVFVQTPSEVIVQFPMPALLNCLASGIPEPMYEWQRRFGSTVGSNVRTVALDDRVIVNNGSLEFRRTYRNDTGFYICRAMNEHGNISSEEVELVVQAPPLPPMNIMVTGKGSSWVMTTWGGDTDSRPPICKYLLEYRLDFESNWTNCTSCSSPNTYLNISDLYPSATYQVRIQADNTLYRSSYSSIQVVMTAEGAPLSELSDRPVNVRVESNASDTLILSWDIPQVLERTSYNGTIVTVESINGHPVLLQQMVASPLVVSNLMVATSYNITLWFVFVGGEEGTPVIAYGTTRDAVPVDAPTMIMSHAISSTSIRLTWNPPTQPNGAITAYTIYYSPPMNSRVTVGGSKRLHDLGMLSPYTNYTIQLSANTSAGEGPMGGDEFVQTLQATPSPPSGVELAALNSTAIYISWQPFSEGDVPGVLTNYTICYNLLHHGGNSILQHIDRNRSSFVLGGLCPYKEYRVKVAASTMAGQGEFSQGKNIQTLGDVPVAIPVIVNVRKVCPLPDLLIEWMSPNRRDLGGAESDVSYNLSYTSTDGTESTIMLNYSPNLTSYTLRGLTPFTSYIVKLALQNQNGTGNFSNPVNGTSCDGAATPPTSIMTETINSTSIRIRWTAPSGVPGTVIGYVIRYGVEGGEYSQANISIGSSLEHIVDDLEPFTLYSVSLATRTEGPLGNFSSDHPIRTLGAVPVVQVSNVSVTVPCPSHLLVKWNRIRPQDLRGPASLSNYTVIYNSSDGQMKTLVVPYSGNQMARLTDLQLRTEYTVTVKVVNPNGSGPISTPQSASTGMEEVPPPPPPRNVIVVALNNAPTLNVTWLSSSSLDEELSYFVHYRRTNTTNISSIMSWPNVTAKMQFSFAILDGLKPFTNYSIVVIARTPCGSSNMAEVEVVTTKGPPPGALQNVSIAAILPTVVRVKWEKPDGVVTGYKVYCRSMVLHVNSSMLFCDCDGLEPETEYSIHISAENSAGEGPNQTLYVNTSCSPPPLSIATMDKQDRINVSLINKACSIRDSILYLLVIVQELPKGQPGRGLESYELSELQQKTKEYASNRGRRQTSLDEGGIYIAANFSKQELVPWLVLGDSMEYGSYTNYPLMPRVSYNITIRGTVRGTDRPLFSSTKKAFTTNGSVESAPSFPLIPAVVVGGAAGLIILAICMAALISCLCCCCSRSLDKTDAVVGVKIERTSSFRLSTKKKHLDPVDDLRGNHRTEALEDHPPIPVMGFINRLMVMRTNDNQLFLEEFGSIPMTVGLSTDVANLPANRSKNRYNNILPYDTNRVKVKGHGTDYINANYCSGYRKLKSYIATQGPLTDTISDFWRMVWEENVQTIVMLTNTQEKGKIKCEVYWPREVGVSAVHGHIDVTLASVITLADYSIRTLNIQKVGSSKEPHEVVQFHFTSWPDHGVPQYATAMLSMMRRVRSHFSPTEEGPMLVHCSAGVGRTGTFIVIDSMLQRLAHEEETVDIYGHVTLLRTQRNYMVQTEDQYFFIHEAIAEALLCGNTEVPASHLPGYLADLCSVIPEDGSDMTNLELQFKRLALERNDPHRWMTANKDANKTKNRFVNVLPYDTSRVCLDYSPGVDGSDYINASHVDSYHTRRAFIATQGPLTNTVNDFWRMLWKHSVPVVVMLTAQVEKGHECSAQYWPKVTLQPVNYGKLKVELNVERNSGTYTYRDLTVTNTADNQKRFVLQFQFHAWPEVGVPSPLVLIEFLREVQKLCQSLNTTGPIVVHCSNGVGRTGVFLSLHIILERLLVEGLVDIFQTVKNLRIQRPAMVQTLEQYHFCYDTTVTFLQSSDALFPSPSHRSSLTRQRNSSRRNSGSRHSSRHSSRHGSRSSVDSHKKSKNPSPTRSPSRSSSLRQTPVPSDSLKESPRGTMMELNGSGGGSQVYGESDTTITFGNHLPPSSNHSVGGGHAESRSPVLSESTSSQVTGPLQSQSHQLSETRRYSNSIADSAGESTS